MWGFASGGLENLTFFGGLDDFRYLFLVSYFLTSFCSVWSCGSHGIELGGGFVWSFVSKS